MSVKGGESRMPLGMFGSVPGTEERYEATVSSTVRMLSGALTPVPRGLIVYHVQDEPGRDGSERVFPYRPNKDPFEFALKVIDQLKEKRHGAQAETGVVLFQVTCAVPRSHFDQLVTFLRDTPGQQTIGGLTLVGAPSNCHAAIGYSLWEAAELVKGLVPLGGVCLAERHLTKGDEPQRMLQKQQLAGVSFFTTQVIYDADLMVELISSYAEAAAAEKTPPARLLLTFAPFSCPKTLQFLRWLGVRVPDAIAARVLEAEDPVTESLLVCRESLARILLACSQRLNYSVPIGVSVESVSGFIKEINASLKLYDQLMVDLAQYLEQMN
ncbi:MAG: hypothetical protein Q8P67_05320 [archaeon]|nr:hypothetical protein [archaeon]